MHNVTYQQELCQQIKPIWIQPEENKVHRTEKHEVSHNVNVNKITLKWANYIPCIHYSTYSLRIIFNYEYQSATY